MPRKLRTPKKRCGQPLTAALRLWLVAGLPPNVHCCDPTDDHTWRCEADPALPPCVTRRVLPGSMAVLFATEADVRDAWREHGAALHAEAAAHGVEPAGRRWFDTRAVRYGAPLDPTTTAAWRQAFMTDVWGELT